MKFCEKLCYLPQNIIFLTTGMKILYSHSLSFSLYSTLLNHLKNTNSNKVHSSQLRKTVEYLQVFTVLLFLLFSFNFFLFPFLIPIFFLFLFQQIHSDAQNHHNELVLLQMASDILTGLDKRSAEQGGKQLSQVTAGKNSCVRLVTNY